MKKTDIDKLNKLQNLFLNVLLGVKNCPAPLMMWDLSVLSIPLIILKNKLILYHHVSTLPEREISHKILKQHMRHKLPGLYDDVTDFLNKYEVTHVTSFTKLKWAHFVKAKIENENREYLLNLFKPYKKLDYFALICEDYEIKP